MSQSLQLSGLISSANNNSVPSSSEKYLPNSILKSTSLRFKREREKIEDINSLFPINQYEINYISDFITNFENFFR